MDIGEGSSGDYSLNSSESYQPNEEEAKKLYNSIQKQQEKGKKHSALERKAKEEEAKKQSEDVIMMVAGISGLFNI